MVSKQMERAPQRPQIASCRYLASMLASVLLVFSVLPVSSAPLQEPVYWDVAQQIREEIFTNTELMDNASWLTDVFGPRVAKSPGYKAAAEWAVEKFKEYGISNSYLEPYEFGIGYVNEYISVHMMKPQYMSLLAYPATWSQGTNGKVQGPAVYLDFSQVEAEIDLEPYRGRLKNALVLTHPKQAISTTIPLLPEGFTEEELDAMAKITVGPTNPVQSERSANRSTLPRQQIIDFVFAEGAAAIVRTDGRTDYGTVVVENNRYTLETRPWEVGATPHPTELVMSAEHYNRIMRILEKGVPVEIEANVRVSFSRNDLIDHNVIAEIPGTDLAHELVIVGAHLEANPAATGAVDDAAGVVATMEAARTLAAIGVRPRRTIRFGLWGGHEMGLFGNRHHVRTNFADPQTKEYKEDYENLSAYFNMDIGSGRIRGVSIMGNERIRSIFLEWMRPLRNLGMTHLFTTGLQHEAYEEVGLPGFYFEQDRKVIDNINAHGSMDTYERLVPEGLMQSAVVLATFAYHAAMRDEKLPRVAPRPW